MTKRKQNKYKNKKRRLKLKEKKKKIEEISNIQLFYLEENKVVLFLSIYSKIDSSLKEMYYFYLHETPNILNDIKMIQKHFRLNMFQLYKCPWKTFIEEECPSITTYPCGSPGIIYCSHIDKEKRREMIQHFKKGEYLLRHPHSDFFFYNEKGELHRENDQPAYILYGDDDTIPTFAFFKNGLIHRNDLPATHEQHSNEITYQQNGKYYRDDDKYPCVISNQHFENHLEWYWKSTGHKKKEIHCYGSGYEEECYCNSPNYYLEKSGEMTTNPEIIKEIEKTCCMPCEDFYSMIGSLDF